MCTALPVTKMPRWAWHTFVLYISVCISPSKGTDASLVEELHGAGRDAGCGTAHSVQVVVPHTGWLGLRARCADADAHVVFPFRQANVYTYTLESYIRVQCQTCATAGDAPPLAIRNLTEHKVSGTLSVPISVNIDHFFK